MSRISARYADPKPERRRWPVVRSVAWVVLVAAVAFWATLLVTG